MQIVINMLDPCKCILFLLKKHFQDFKKCQNLWSEQQDKPGARLGTTTPVAAKIFLICSSTFCSFAAGLGQSVPFIDAGFQTPRVTSAQK